VDRVITLPKSHRCSNAVWDFGQRVLSGCSDFVDHGVTGNGEEGSVSPATTVREAVRRLPEGAEILVLTRTNDIADKVSKQLAAGRVPHTRDDEDLTDLAAIAITSKLANGESLISSELRLVIDLLPAAALRHRTREASNRALNELDLRRFTAEETGLFTKAMLAEFADGSWIKRVKNGRGREWIEQVNRHGLDLATAPRIKVRTAHAVKGGEADHVILVGSQSKCVYRNVTRNRGAEDEERRLAYVAITRARVSVQVVRGPRSLRWMIPQPTRPKKIIIENTSQVRCLPGKKNPTIIEG
jgi:hypothetical protein